MATVTITLSVPDGVPREVIHDRLYLATDGHVTFAQVGMYVDSFNALNVPTASEM